MNTAFTITSDEIDQLHKEYEINDCIYFLMKSKELVGGEMTINQAIEKLKHRTRFADEVVNIYKKNNGYARVLDYLEK